MTAPQRPVPESAEVALHRLRTEWRPSDIDGRHVIEVLAAAVKRLQAGGMLP